MAVRVKLIQVKIGDTIQQLAARELGDVQRWRELVQINGLRPPYIVPSINEADKEPNSLLWGEFIAVPSIGDTGPLTGAGVYGVDPWCVQGQLIANEDGDLALAGGTDNLGQALQHRISTPFRSYLPHPDYGCEVHTLLGVRNRPAAALLGAGFARRATLRDPRIEEARAGAHVLGDRLYIMVTANPVTKETPFDANLVLTLPQV